MKEYHRRVHEKGLFYPHRLVSHAIIPGALPTTQKKKEERRKKKYVQIKNPPCQRTAAKLEQESRIKEQKIIIIKKKDSCNMTDCVRARETQKALATRLLEGPK